MSCAETIKRAVVNYLGEDEGNISSESTFASLGADSLDMVEIIMAVEEDCAVIIDDDEEQKFKTVGDLIAYVEKLKGGAA